MSNIEETGIQLTLRGGQAFRVDVKNASHEVKNLGDAAEHAGRKARTSSGGFGFLGGTFGFLEKWAKRATLGVAALVGVVAVKASSAFNAYQATVAQTNAVLKSTGGIAGVTAGHVENLANSMERYSGLTRTALRTTENMLLTFPKIRNFTGAGNNVYDQTVSAVIDLSRAMHQPLKNTAIQIGKALQDPLRGLLALRRVGVDFGPADEKRIKNLAKTGHLLQAQKEILAEINKEFGGSARAYGLTAAGRLDHFKAVIQDLGITAGKTFIPMLEAPLSQINDQLDHFAKNAPGWANNLQNVFSNFFHQIPNLVQAIRKNGGIGAAVDAMFGGSGFLTKPIDKLVQIGRDLWHIWQDGVYPAFKTFARLFMAASWVAVFVVLSDTTGFLADHARILKPLIYAMATAWAIHGVAVGISWVATKAQAFWTAINIERMALSAAATGIATVATWLYDAALTAVVATMVAFDIATLPAILIVGGLVLGFALLAAGLIYLYFKWKPFHDLVNKFFSMMLESGKAVIGWFKQNWGMVLFIVAAPFVGAADFIIKNFDTIKTAFIDVMNFVIREWDRLASKLKFHIPGTNTDFGLPTIGEIGGKKGVGGKISSGVGAGFGSSFGGFGGVPKAHTGGMVTSGGLVNMQPGEEMVYLPPAARVVPLPPSSRLNMPGQGGNSGPETIYLTVDGKVLTKVVLKNIRGEAARL